MIKSKLLSDAGWKDVASKSKVKDNGLLKALEKLKRVGDDDHDDATKALDEITKLAGLLKKDKAVAAVPPAAKYIADMLDEAQSVARDVAKAKTEHANAQKAKAEAEKKAAAKHADDDDEDEEEVETSELLTTKLKPLLKLVAKGQTMHALVAKSGKKVVVMLSRKPIPPARRKMLAEELGGGSTKFYPGTCSVEAGATTFELKSEVAGMAKLVKLALLEQTGLRLNKLMCRGEDGDDHDEDADEAHDAAAAASGASGAQGAAATVRPDACVTPDATATDCFFDYGSADLTPSDKTFLEAYAKAYLRSKASEKIILEGFASVDGDKGRNMTLSHNRAAQTARYLVAHGVNKSDFSGKGPTDSFSKSNLCLNRRVTIRPPIDLKVRDFIELVEEEPRNVPIPGRTPSTSLGEKAKEGPVPDPPQPPEVVSREVVREALKAWLLDLGKAQKVNAREADVLSTKRVNDAEETLRGNYGRGGEKVDGAAVTPPNGDGRGYRAGALADQIANNLPDEIPKVNFDNFKKMAASEAPKEKSTLEQAADKLDQKADEILSDFKVPKKYWGDIKDAIKKQVPKLLDKLPDDVKDAAKKVYDKAIESTKDK